MASRLTSAAVMAGLLLGAGGTAAVATGATTPDATTPTSTSPTPTPANPTPPKSTTGGAESVSRTGATLTASVETGGADTTYRFEYGTTTAYGLTTPDAVLPAASAAGTVKRAITGLTVETTYHYRVVAINAAGTTRGADRTLRTSANPKAPSVSVQAPADLRPQTATFVARVNPQGQATTFYFQYGTSTKYGLRTADASAGAGTATITATAPVSGLSANTKYNVRVVAVNATGTRRSTNRSFTTPRALTGISASAAPDPVVWNGSAIVSGTVGGAGVGGVGVALLRQDFPYTGPFAQVATQTASSAGAFSFSVGPLYAAARFQVATRSTTPIASPVVSVRSALYAKGPSISRRKSKSVRLTSTVYPAVPKGRASVQRRSPKGGWVRVKRVSLTVLEGNRSRVRVTVPRISRTARYRIVISPRDAGAHVTTTTKSVSVSRRSR